MICDTKDVRLSVYYEPVSQAETEEELFDDDGNVVDEGWQEIPTIDEGVETHIRKEGAPSLTYLTNVHFPLEWRDTNYSQYIHALDGQSTTQLAKVEFRRPSDTSGDLWGTVHTGYVRQFGSAGNGRKMRLQIGDISDFMGKIPASKTFNGASIDDVLSYVAGELNKYLNFVSDITYTDLSQFDDTLRKQINFVGKSFTSNKHTLTDVINWFTKAVGGYWWFSGNSVNNVHLNYAIDPEWLTEAGRDAFLQLDGKNDFDLSSREWMQDRLRDEGQVSELKEFAFERSNFTEANLYAENNDISYDDAAEYQDNVVVLDNQALFQLQPVNSVTVYGDSPMSINNPVQDINLEFFTTGLSSQEYPVGIATYEPLRELAEAPLSPPIIESDASTIEGAEREAKEKLEDQLNEAQGGEMTLLGNQMLTPYDTIKARPACQGRTDVSTNPIEYEIQSLVHSCPAGERYRTEVDVSLHIDPSKIDTSDSHIQDE